MNEKFRIAGYCRISVDEEMDKDNTSIENQKAIISDYVTRTFPDSTLDFYADRDRSGYTFEQRENYQKMRKKLFHGEYDILIIKDFSRFSRRTSRGLVELEDLREAGMRIISIGDGIDFPTSDEWMAIQFRFLINEMPVTDTSKKVKAVIKHRQEEGKWICAVPYGYIMTNTKAMKFVVDEPSAEVVRKVFRLYADGWGYKRIANYLTDQHIPTPRKTEEMRKEAAGEEYTVRSKAEWSLVTISEILSNDFYIGTLRQRKYRRKKINGGDEKLQEVDNIVIANNHEPIVDYKLFSVVQEQMKQRSRSNYRGIKKYDNVYTGHLFCGDCGSPMFSMSRSDLPPAYRCGTYHKRGIKGCSSHHTRVDMLDELLKSFVQKVKDNSEAMLEQLQSSIDKEQKETSSSKNVVEVLLQRIEDIKTELKFLSRQHVKDIAKHPEREDMLEEVYQEQVDDLMLQIEGFRNQIQLATDKHNAIIAMNRTAKTVMEVFDTIINKDNLTKTDVDFILDRIDVYTDHIDIKLKSDIDTLLHTGVPDELQLETTGAAVNFNSGTKKADNLTPIAHISTSKGEILSVNVISEGDPLEIYTNSEGEVIFKKYSAISEMSENAGYVADIMHKIAGCAVLIFDKDHVVATAGAARKEFSERRASGQLEELMENRGQFYCPDGSTNNFFPAEGVDRTAIAAVPIITSGDVSGSVVFLTSEKAHEATDMQKSLINAAAQFLARQIEG
ncbi:stage V sporulation T C-terminal domain-containing protein [uncultured Ruminococcus sp.]|uniref:stage V sporulation T C-terminal domain-containing protein n=1 Tax=uncultured Ruminococcus sp. TaxID=165186 RepID=UPI0025DDA180|nr:stage V sporulation T C-terminal domain-containing protein [uncultured Ruminococcus sp.]